MTGLGLAPSRLEPFFLDRSEVTNREFRDFESSGGYGKPEYWQRDFVEAGGRLSFEEAMARFRDATDRPGPAAWQLGDYPEGEADLPVRGVSWFEAEANCRFRGRILLGAVFSPQEHLQSVSEAIVPLSNLAGSAPASRGGTGEWGRTAATTWLGTSRSGS